MIQARRLRFPIVVLTCALLCAGCNWIIGAEGRIERARKEIAAGNDRAAAIELQNALRSEPEHVEARLMLAELSLRLGDAKSAQRDLAQAIEHGAPPQRTAALAAEARLALGEHRQLLDEIGAGKSPLAEPALSTYRGLALLQANELEQAIAAFQQALAIDAKSSRARIALAEALAASGQSDAAIETLGVALDHNPKDAAVLAVRGNLLLRRGEFAAASTALTAARDHAAGQLSVTKYLAVLGALIETQLASNAVGDAETTFKELAKQAPDAPATRVLAARIAMARHDYTTAVAEAQKALTAAPQFLPAKLVLGVALLAQGNLNQAEVQLAELVQLAPGSAEARKLLARVNLQLRRPDVAMRLLASVQQTDVDDPEVDALLVPAMAAAQGPAAARAQIDRIVADNPNDLPTLRRAASLYAQQREFDRARSVLTRVLELEPGDTATLLARARVEFAAGQRQAAVTAAQQVVAADPANLGARVLIAQLAARDGDLTKAIEQLEIVRAKNADAIEARIMLATAYLNRRDVRAADAVIGELQRHGKSKPAVAAAIGQLYQQSGRFAEALGWFQEAARQDQGNPQPGLNVARMQLAMGDKALARETLQKLVTAFPDSVPAASDLIFLDLSEGRPEAAGQRLAKLRSAHPTDARVYLVEGDVALATKAYPTAADAYAAALKLAPTGETAVRVHRARQLGGLPDPLGPLKTWLEQNPGDAAVRLTLAQAYLSGGAADQAVGEYERLVRADPSNPMALNNLAWLYLQNKDPRAVETARRAYTAAPEVVAIGDTYGWILVETGSVDAGLEILKKIISSGAAQPDIRYHYAAALARAGQRDAARRELLELTRTKEQYAAAADARRLLAELGAE